MKLYFGKKEEKIIDGFYEHLNTISEGLKYLNEFFDSLTSNNPEIIDDKYTNVISNERKADKIRRKIETDMYQGAFLPNFRGDLLGLIESLDKVMNKAETVADILYMQRPNVPPEIFQGMRKQMELSINAYNALSKAIQMLFTSLENVTAYVAEVEKMEHDEDTVEKDLIRKVFMLDLPLASKLELKEVIINIGDIADRAEDSSDRVEIIILKRSV